MIKNITLSADEELIRMAREKALEEKRSLNAAFREWLERYAAQQRAVGEYKELMERLRYARSAGPYTREEMNERR